MRAALRCGGERGVPVRVVSRDLDARRVKSRRVQAPCPGKVLPMTDALSSALSTHDQPPQVVRVRWSGVAVAKCRVRGHVRGFILRVVAAAR
jgi:hypothetical protein